MRAERGAAEVSSVRPMSSITSTSLKSLFSSPKSRPEPSGDNETDLQRITAEILSNNDITVPPVAVHRILERLGVNFEQVEFSDSADKKRLIAFTKRDGLEFSIHTNAELSIEDQQFGLAREFARYYLQRETIRPFACTYMDSLLLPEKTPPARELTMFADYLLVPDHILRKYSYKDTRDAAFIQKTFFVPQAVAGRRIR